MVLPGVGFDVVASDCLIAHVSSRLPNAALLQLGISGLGLMSRGSAQTIYNFAGEPVRVRANGRIVSKAGLREKGFDFGHGVRPAMAVSWGDVSSAWHTTGIPNVEVYFETTPPFMLTAFANRTFGWMLRSPMAQQTAKGFVERLPHGPSETQRLERNAVLVARVEDANGNLVESRLITNEAYTFTSLSACAITERVLAGEWKPGFQTPGGLYGGDFVLSIGNSSRIDL